MLRSSSAVCENRVPVAGGRWRGGLDLYFRIAVVVLRVPPLRERVADIPLLAAHFLKECGHEGSPELVIPARVMEELCAHRWPGNVRELRNWVEATVAMGESPELAALSARGVAALTSSGGALGNLSYKDARSRVLEDFEKRYLTQLLSEAGGNVALAARTAQMDRTYLIKLIQRHGLRTK